MRPWMLAALLAGAAGAQTTMPNSDWRSAAVASTATGVRLEFRTGATGMPVPLSSRGSLAGNQSPIHRLVVDRDGRIVFAYDVTGDWGPDKETFRIKLMPLDRAYEDRIRKESWFPEGSSSGADGRLPTLAAVRELPLLKSGETVQVDLLENPATGARVFDRIRVMPQPQMPQQHYFVLRQQLRTEMLSLSAVRVSVNGKPAGEGPPAALEGQTAVLWLPGHGTFYLSAEKGPQSLASLPVGWADKNRLAWTWANNSYELVSGANVLMKSESGTVWVFHSPEKPRMMRAEDASRLWIATGSGALR